MISSRSVGSSGALACARTIWVEVIIACARWRCRNRFRHAATMSAEMSATASPVGAGGRNRDTVRSAPRRTHGAWRGNSGRACEAPLASAPISWRRSGRVPARRPAGWRPRESHRAGSPGRRSPVGPAPWALMRGTASRYRSAHRGAGVPISGPPPPPRPRRGDHRCVSYEKIRAVGRGGGWFRGGAEFARLLAQAGLNLILVARKPGPLRRPRGCAADWGRGAHPGRRPGRGRQCREPARADRTASRSDCWSTTPEPTPAARNSSTATSPTSSG